MENIDQFLELLGHEKDFFAKSCVEQLLKDQIHYQIYKLFSQANRGNGQTVKFRISSTTMVEWRNRVPRFYR
jgi:hypothetical protein